MVHRRRVAVIAVHLVQVPGDHPGVQAHHEPRPQPLRDTTSARNTLIASNTSAIVPGRHRSMSSTNTTSW
ncbi:hypothetical protein ACFQY4_25705 [Catellatospora bangladeshensis]|uniref:hypothetical protein n=1 Tax=Catellatospora bangladeshensis TaxID=310355 RepID=UPI00360C11DA